MKKFHVNVEVIRSYVVEVEAATAGRAVALVQDLDLEDLEKDGNYVDTHVEVDDEPEEEQE